MPSRQARYQAKRRAESGGQVAFFPRDRAVLDEAVKASGKTQQTWLADAVEQKAERERAPSGRIDAITLRAVEAFLEQIRGYYQVSQAILFGSRARGTHRPDSDADIAVVLRDDWGKRSTVAVAMAGVAFDIFLDTGVLVDPLPLRQDELDHPERFGNPQLIETIRRDGIQLWE